MINRATLLKIFFAILWVPPLSFASSCVIVSEEANNSIEVLINDEKDNNPFGLKENCAKVKLQSGQKPIEVFYKDANDAPQRKTLQAGEEIALNDSADFFSGLTVEKFKQIISPSESITGGRRLDDDSSIPGFPAGDVLKPNDNLAFTISPNLVANGLQTFTLFQEGGSQPLFEQRTPGNKIEIPAKYFEPGRSYRWVAKSSNQSYDDTFRIATREDQEGLEQDLAKSRTEWTGSPLAESVLKAELYHEYGFSFDRNQEIKKIYAGN